MPPILPQADASDVQPWTFATLCSGADIPSYAWEPKGGKARFFSEIASAPIKLLAHHWGEVPNLGDLEQIDGTAHEGKVDVLWASFPCQPWSDAGLGLGLSDPRGRLTLSGVRVIDEIDPPIFCFENVVKLLNNKENAFGKFLGRLAGERDALHPYGKPDGVDIQAGRRWPDCGYVLGPRRAIAWRVFDGPEFGVPQSRRRLVLIACTRRSGIDPRRIVHEPVPPCDALGQRYESGADVVPGIDGRPVFRARTVAVRGRVINGFDGQQIEEGGQIANCLRTASGGSSIGMLLVHERGDWRIRNHTVAECERLMGMSGTHTDVPGLSDTERRTIIGNSLIVPMVDWIGDQILKVLHEAA
ncbi:DNA methyltransferase [Caulobacter phage CcrRogue]|uniref:DNA (cytosine-5-)-methyltransferase n=1 Tax=Caulobacter phage CcrRogue TaxID=2927986 RepID=K4JS84_9CAUD|nr:DNA methyltransferase [Caulobacter phage CcrRogue]AFU86603.1 putative DNA cytosine methyltransferase [Caulobacter phage CcrRogue]